MPKQPDNPERDLHQACGERWIRAAERIPAVKTGLELMGIERVTREYFLFWHEAKTDDERRQTWREFRVAVRQGVLTSLGVHGAIGTSIHLVLSDLRFSVLLTASVLMAPHLGIYDLVVLAPVFLWVENWIAENTVHPNANILRVTLYFVFLSPLLAPLTRYSHLQLSVLAILALHFALARTVRTSAFRTETS